MYILKPPVAGIPVPNGKHINPHKMWGFRRFQERSLVGYGTVRGVELFFWALNFQISEPEIWQKSLFLQSFRDFFPGNFGL